MELTCKLGKTQILLNDASTSYFFIDDDLAELFNLETNNEALKLLQKTLKEKFQPNRYKRISFDYESSAVIICTTNSKLILDIALVINELTNINLSYEEINITKKVLLSHKRPKKQKWGIGDIFPIPLSDRSYYFGQIIGKIEGITPICIILDLNKNGLPENEELASADILGALSFVPNNIDNFTFKVFNNFPMFRQVAENVRTNPIIDSQYSSNCIIDFCEEIKNRGITSKYWGFIDNKNYLK
jgi:hypothetical protein